jgi:hypothetical protein
MGFVPVPSYRTDNVRDDKCKDSIEEEQEKYDNDDNDDKLKQEDPDSKVSDCKSTTGNSIPIEALSQPVRPAKPQIHHLNTA